MSHKLQFWFLRSRIYLLSYTLLVAGLMARAPPGMWLECLTHIDHHYAMFKLYPYLHCPLWSREVQPLSLVTDTPSFLDIMIIWSLSPCNTWMTDDLIALRHTRNHSIPTLVELSTYWFLLTTIRLYHPCSIIELILDILELRYSCDTVHDRGFISTPH